MPIENFNLIKDLVPSNPASGDNANGGDDHIRGIKQTLVNTFPNVTTPITATSAQLNDVVQLRTDVNNNYNNAQSRVAKTGDVMTGALTVPYLTTPPGGAVNAGQIQQNGVTLLPWGVVMMWPHGLNNIPPGWLLCDGQNGTLDMRDMFIVGGGGGYALGTRGGYLAHNFPTAPGGAQGAAQTSESGGHDHGGRVAGTAINVDQMPPHQHTIGSIGYQGGVPDGIGTPDAPRSDHDPAGDGPKLATSVVGGAQAHDHAIPWNGNHVHQLPTVPNHNHMVNFDNRPPFVVVAYIQKV